MVTPRIGRWWYRQASNIDDSRSVQHVVTIFMDISGIWGNTISGIQGNATIFLGYEAPLGFDPLLSTKTLLKLASSGHDYKVWERESKKGGRTYLKDRAGQFTTAKFYCLVKQQFWTPHLYIWRFILNISWSVVHPALNKTCDFRTKKPLRSSCIRNISWNFQMQSSKVYATDCVGKGASECHHPKWQHRHLYWIIPR
jgi:hypothetical protein